MPFFKNRKIKQWRKLSYSQSGEDLIIRFIFDELQIKKPSYIDVGAHHPFYLSNTALFYESGSKGINIEPDPLLFKPFTQYRKRDINLNIGIGENKGEADFYIISSPTLNTFSKQEAENYSSEGDYKIVRVIKTPVNSIANVIQESNNGVFPQLLNLDAEGIDELIIRSIDYTKSYPLVICIETISFSTSGNGIKNTEIINFILSMGYILYADTYINSIFVKKDIWHRKVQ
ncbi:FkbM family methyltransferase [Mucilaginibacter sp. HC2]|uniref:FkbM family methyltransferase n=1 Tax=Mucilaginibacter inviolabilis TaxID=2714892 RepID=UPI00140A3915|nr:FkbM family methyltransferase [Mucilaginibacter inviolabilis]NHA04939.1 FkbM family methyltransferase [Mucilaginibacter inviolabilis]